MIFKDKLFSLDSQLLTQVVEYFHNLADADVARSPVFQRIYGGARDAEVVCHFLLGDALLLAECRDFVSEGLKIHCRPVLTKIIYIIVSIFRYVKYFSCMLARP